MICDLLEKQGIAYVRAAARLDQREDCARYAVAVLAR